MNLSTKQKQTHRPREQICGCQGGGWRREGVGVWDQQMQTIYMGWKSNEVLRYSTGNCIQYPGINHNGKEYEKKYMYIIYTYITKPLQCAAENINTTLAQQCKPAVLQ